MFRVDQHVIERNIGPAFNIGYHFIGLVVVVVAVEGAVMVVVVEMVGIVEGVVVMVGVGMVVEVVMEVGVVMVERRTSLTNLVPT